MIGELLSNPWVIVGGFALCIIIVLVVVYSVLSDPKPGGGTSDIENANADLMDARDAYEASGYQDHDPGSASGFEKVW